MKLPEGAKPLIGTEEATLDDKNRLIFSKKKRERLGEGFVFTVGAMGCLEAYPESVWNEMVEWVLEGRGVNMARAQMARLMLGDAEDEQNFDAQGRVVIPAKLRKKAGLDKGVLIIGVGDHVEIWDAKKHEEFEVDPERYRTRRFEAMETAQLKMEGKWLELPPSR